MNCDILDMSVLTLHGLIRYDLVGDRVKISFHKSVISSNTPSRLDNLFLGEYWIIPRLVVSEDNIKEYKKYQCCLMAIHEEQFGTFGNFTSKILLHANLMKHKGELVSNYTCMWMETLSMITLEKKSLVDAAERVTLSE